MPPELLVLLYQVLVRKANVRRKVLPFVRSALWFNAIACSLGFLESNAPYCDRHPHNPNNAGNDPVCNLSILGVSCKAQAQASIDNPKCDEQPTPDGVDATEEFGLAFCFEDSVVDCSRGYLQKEQADNCQTNGWVVFVELFGEYIVSKRSLTTFST